MICSVWGREYCDALTSLCIPSLLTSENLPQWPWLEETTLVLYSRESDFEYLKTKSSFQRFCQYLRVEFRDITPWMKTLSRGTYYPMMYSHQDAVKQAHAHQAGMIILSPDIIFSNKALLSLADSINNQKKLIMIPSGRAVTEDISSHLQLKEDDSLDLSARECIDLWVNHMHLYTRGLFLNASNFNKLCCEVYYWTESHQIEGRYLYTHPLFIGWPQRPYEPEEGAIDGMYLEPYFGGGQHTEVYKNEELFVLSLTQRRHTMETVIHGEVPWSTRQSYIDQYRRLYTRKLHRWLFKQPVSLSTNQSRDITPADIEARESCQSMEVFWEIEEAYYQKQYADLIRCFEMNEELFKNRLASKPFQALYQWVASSYYYQGRLEPLSEFLEQYRNHFIESFNYPVQEDPPEYPVYFVSQSPDKWPQKGKVIVFGKMPFSEKHHIILRKHLSSQDILNHVQKATKLYIDSLSNEWKNEVILAYLNHTPVIKELF